MGELERRMQALNQVHAANLAAAQSQTSQEAAKGRRLVDEFVSMMQRYGVPPQPLWMHRYLPVTTGRRLDLRRTVTSTLIYEIVGAGWPLKHPSSSEWGSVSFLVLDKGIASSVAPSEVPLPAARKWHGHRRDGKFGEHEAYHETLVNWPISPGSDRFISGLWGQHTVRGPRTVLVASGIDGSDFAYSQVVCQADAIAGMANELLEMRSAF